MKEKIISGQTFSKIDCILYDKVLMPYIKDSTFVDCNFNGTNFRGVDLGGSKGCAFISCDFDRVSFGTTTRFNRCNFTKCIFRNIEWSSSLSFNDTLFRDCKFAGRIDDAVFWGSPVFERRKGILQRLGLAPERILHGGLVDVDFSQCDVRHIDFRGNARLVGITLPPHSFWTSRETLAIQMQDTADAPSPEEEFSQAYFQLIDLSNSDEYQIITKDAALAIQPNVDFSKLRRKLEHEGPS